MPLYGTTLLDEYAMWVAVAQLAETAGQYHRRTNFTTVLTGPPSPPSPGLCSLLAYCTESPSYGLVARQERRNLIDLCYRRMSAWRNPNLDPEMFRINLASYWWPRTRWGWGKRAEFAWKMAEQIAREMDGPA